MRTIEQLASAAGFDVEPDLRKPDGTPYIVGPGSHAENCATQLARFAALVAEECANIAESLDDEGCDTGWGQTQHDAAAAIREAFSS